jgi:putative hydrolase
MTAFNNGVAQNLRKIAALLKEQQANYFRCQAYLHAAQTIEHLPQDLRVLFEEQGIQGLIHLPTIGTGIAHLIYEHISTGRMSKLENLQGSSDPISLYQVIPTVGIELAQRIHDKLHVDTLEELESAVHTGQLNQIEGLGKKRQQAITDWLSNNFNERNKNLSSYTTRFGEKKMGPSVSLLLKVDDQYRTKALAKKLPLIAPKRFNLEHKSWLPILHTTQENWHFTAIYSNTERAHKLDKIFDWVVIFFYDNQHQEGHHTVVTETHGNNTGKRVVRGREYECRVFYETSKQAVS